MKETVLFGASQYGKSALNLLENQHNIIGFIDNAPEKWGTIFCGYQVYSPDFLHETSADVIITSSYADEIKKQLQQMNFWNYKVFSYSTRVD